MLNCFFNGGSMKISLIGFLLLFAAQLAFAQNWNAYPAGSIGVPYVNGPMTATVTRVNTTMNSGTPMFTTSTSPDCYIAAGSLALNAGFFNSYIANSSRIQVDFDFTSGGNNGMCNSAAFTIRDINSGESFTDFLDVVEISAIDGNNAAVPAANITVTPPANVTVVTIGTTKKIVGHNSASEVVTGGPYSSTPCNLTSVSVSPPANTPLKSMRIVYRPAVGTSAANAYFSVGTHPAVQYISISNLTLTPTGGGCVVLPMGLAAFKGEEMDDHNLLRWAVNETALNRRFLLEKSTDGVNYSVFANVEEANGMEYTLIDPSPASETFYRLTPIDGNGNGMESVSLVVRRQSNNTVVFTMSPTIANGQVMVTTFLQGENQLVIWNFAGMAVSARKLHNAGNFKVGLDALASGVYWLSVDNGGKRSCQKLVVAK
jgi:hypothetical protein